MPFHRKRKKPQWKKEKEEHPWMTKAQAKRIVKDHTRKKRKKRKKR